MNFKRICALLAARRCFNSGQSIEKIAKSAGKTPRTIRKWLKATEK